MNQSHHSPVHWCLWPAGYCVSQLHEHQSFSIASISVYYGALFGFFSVGEISLLSEVCLKNQSENSKDNQIFSWINVQSVILTQYAVHTMQFILCNLYYAHTLHSMGLHDSHYTVLFAFRIWLRKSTRCDSVPLSDQCLRSWPRRRLSNRPKFWSSSVGRCVEHSTSDEICLWFLERKVPFKLHSYAPTQYRLLKPIRQIPYNTKRV